MSRKNKNKNKNKFKNLEKMSSEKKKIMVGFYNSDFNPFFKKNEISHALSTTSFIFLGTIATPPLYCLSIAEIKFENFNSESKTALMFENGNASIPLQVYYANEDTVLDDLIYIAKDYHLELKKINTAVGEVFVFLGTNKLKKFIDHVYISDEEVLNYYKNLKNYKK